MVAKSLLSLGVATIILAPTLSAFNLNQISATVPVALSALLALSIFWPSISLIVATSIFPISEWITQTFSLGPMRLSEALVLVVLGGTIIRLAVSPKEIKAGAPEAAIGIVSACFLFIGVTATSIVVELSLMQTGITATWLNVWTFLAETLSQITSDYLLENSVGSLPGLADGALLIEGLLLVLIILKYSGSNPALPRNLAGALIIGAFISAVINLNPLATTVMEADEPMTMLARYLGGLRLSGHIQDLNATGSYFLTMMFVGIGFISARKDSRILGFAILTIGVAFWLAGSRSALVASLVIVFSAAGKWVLSKQQGRSRTVLIALVLVVSLLTPLLMVMAYPERSRLSTGFQHRRDFTITSVRMWATAPVFGVGNGRYYDLSGDFMPSTLQEQYANENAHNNFLQIASELGTIGLAAFLWFIFLGARSIWKKSRIEQQLEPLLVWTCAGVSAFLLTCVLGHPLLVRETAYPFWVLSGLTLTLSIGGLTEQSVSKRRHTAFRCLTILVLVASIPQRVNSASCGRPFGEVSLGLFEWEIEPNTDLRFRWSSDHATFFIPADAQWATFPLRAVHAGANTGVVTVNISLGGQPVMQVPLTDQNWTEVSLKMSRTQSSCIPHRFDFDVFPAFVPSSDLGTTDERILGVQLKELTIR